MKHFNVIASVILAAAVLLAAYAIGRLIRQSRMDRPAPQTTPVASPNDVHELQAVRPGPRGKPAPARATQEERAQLKEQRAAELAEMQKLTDEQKMQKRDQWREQLRSKRGSPKRVPHLSPQEFAEIKQRLSEMSEEEQRAFLARMRAGKPTAPVTAEGAAKAGEGDPNKTD